MNTVPSPDADFEREKWRAEHELELEKWHLDRDLKQREQKVREEEIDVKKQELRVSRLTNPLTIAIFTAAAAGLVNIGLNWLNNRYQLELEDKKSGATLSLERNKDEATRILEMLKAPDPDKAATNLGFLAEVGLISDPALVQLIQTYIKNRKPGTGAVISTGARAGEVGFSGACDANHHRIVCRYDNSGGLTVCEQVVC